MTVTRILTQVFLGAGMLLPCVGQSPVPPVHLYPAAGERLRAPAMPTLVHSGGVYTLTWTSPDHLEQTEYEINTNLALTGPNVADGVLNVKSVLRSRANANDPYVSTEFQALSGAGLIFRTSYNPALPPTVGIVFPNAFAGSGQQSIVSFGHSVLVGNQGNADTLVLTYEEAYATGSGPAIRLIKEYKLRLFGRCLRIAATGKAVDATGATVPAFVNNYTGWSAGTVKDLTCAKPQHVPYMDSVPVLIGGQTLNPQPIWSTMVDWNRSNATVTHPVDFTEQGSQTGGCFNAHRFEIGTLYGAASATGNELVEILRPVSEVIYLTVSDSIEDTFPVIDRPASPYRAFLAPKLIATQNVPHFFWSVKDWSARFFGYDESAHAGARGVGMDNALLIKWDWTSVPQHLLNPTMLPVCYNPLYGSLKSLTQLVAARGATTILYFYRVMDQGYSPPYTIESTDPPQNLVLSTNPNYDADVITKKFNGDPQLGWRTYKNLEALDKLPNVTVTPTPSELLDPHATHIIALSEAGEVLDQLAWSEIKPGGPGGCPDTPGEFLQVSGLHLDAEYEIPGGPEVDHTKGSTKGQSIGENIMARAKLFLDGRTIMQGPLFSENTHWRSVQYESYMAGLLDGVNRKIAIPWKSLRDQETLPPHSDYFMLPDYELRHVQPKSTGFYGMGYEEQFKPKGDGPLTESWADEWFSTIVTYGHSGHILFNGDETQTAYWTREATAKSYYLLSGLQSVYHLRPVEVIEYFPNPNAPGVSLSELLKSNVGSTGCADLCAPRMHIRYRYGNVNGQTSPAGLDIWVNHAETDWVVPANVAGLMLVLPKNGFVAYSDPAYHGNGMFAYTGYHPDTYDPDPVSPVKDRVEYVMVPGQYEMLDRRGKDQTFLSQAFGSQPFPDSAMLSEAAATFSAAGLGASAIDNALFVSNHVHGMRLYAYDSNIFDFQGTTPGDFSDPVVIGLEVSSMDSTALTIAAPERGLIAEVVYDNGARRAVTSLAAWSSSHPSVASVNVNGVVARLFSAGVPVTISASYGGFSGSIQVTCPAKAVVEELKLSNPAPHSYAFECRVDAPCQFVELSYKLVGSPTFTKQAMHGAPSGKSFGLVLANLPPGQYVYFVTVTPRVGFGPVFNYPLPAQGFTAY